MKRLKFNEGGQPVFLDDLKTLQDNQQGASSQLMSVLGNGQKAFLLKKPDIEISTVSEDELTTTFTLKAGTLVVDGIAISWSDTQLTIGDWETPIYLVVKRTETGGRVFQDGQTRNCNIEATVTPTLDNSGAEEYYSLYDLKTLNELILDFLDLKDTAWQNLSVNFKNGYSGIVKYQDLDVCRKIYIKIQSSNVTPVSGSVDLFYTSESFMQAFRSPVTASVASENGIQSFEIEAFDGMVRANISLPADDLDSPSNLPVKIIFELPK